MIDSSPLMNMPLLSKPVISPSSAPFSLTLDPLIDIERVREASARAIDRIDPLLQPVRALVDAQALTGLLPLASVRERRRGEEEQLIPFVCFRGTQSFLDLKRDLACAVPAQLTTHTHKREAGVVGKGFLEMHQQFLRMGLLDETRRLLNLSRAMRTQQRGRDSEREDELIVCGHSLGGAVSSLFLAELATDFPQLFAKSTNYFGFFGFNFMQTDANTDRERVKIVTFGAPRSVSAAVAEKLDALPNVKHLRFVNDTDVITAMPPPTATKETFRHCGQAVFLTASNELPSSMSSDGRRETKTNSHAQSCDALRSLPLSSVALRAELDFAVDCADYIDAQALSPSLSASLSLAVETAEFVRNGAAPHFLSSSLGYFARVVGSAEYTAALAAAPEHVRERFLSLPLQLEDDIALRDRETHDALRRALREQLLRWSALQRNVRRAHATLSALPQREAERVSQELQRAREAVERERAQIEALLLRGKSSLDEEVALRGAAWDAALEKSRRDLAALLHGEVARLRETAELVEEAKQRQQAAAEAWKEETLTATKTAVDTLVAELRGQLESVERDVEAQKSLFREDAARMKNAVDETLRDHLDSAEREMRQLQRDVEDKKDLLIRKQSSFVEEMKRKAREAHLDTKAAIEDKLQQREQQLKEHCDSVKTTLQSQAAALKDKLLFAEKRKRNSHRRTASDAENTLGHVLDKKKK